MYADIENALKTWARANDYIAPTVTDTAGRVNVYLAMPAASPPNALILQRLGGAPFGRGDVPADVARISFDCWGADRASAMIIAAALVTELDNLGPSGGYDLPGVRLETAEIALWSWVPDVRTDAPRYVVDARIWSISTG